MLSFFINSHRGLRRFTPVRSLMIDSDEETPPSASRERVLKFEEGEPRRLDWLVSCLRVCHLVALVAGATSHTSLHISVLMLAEASAARNVLPVLAIHVSQSMASLFPHTIDNASRRRHKGKQRVKS